jgi:hypothetical protein
MADLSVDVPPWVIAVAFATPDGETVPQYNAFKQDYRLMFQGCQAASSNIGLSYATIRLVTGLPATDQLDVEYAEQAMAIGDRVLIGLQKDNGIAWQFAGYVTTGSMLIDGAAESFTYRILGPEWLWGEGSPGDGAMWQIVGQFRRNGDTDDHWATNPSYVSAYNEWDLYPNEKTIFNPDGRGNMTIADVQLAPSGQLPVLGRIWEWPDRRLNGIPQSARWTIKEAVKVLVTQYNPLPFSGIEAPINWDDPDEIPFADGTEVLPETDVTGLGLWEALRRVLGPKYFFSVDPRPNGYSWSGFKLRFHSRLTGPDADLRLNVKGTYMQDAVASITRLESALDVSKSVNRVEIFGRDAKHVRLIYWGQATPTLDSKKRKTALQHAWTQDDGAIYDYATINDDGLAIVNVTSVDGAGATERQNWKDRYVTTGKLFQQYPQVFRRFAWNEDGSLPVEWASSYGASDPITVIQPNLSDIADGVERPLLYSRRPRIPLDSLFLRNSESSGFERVRPTLYMAIAPTPDDINYNAWIWHTVPQSAYVIDPARCAINFVVDDLAHWKPFDKQDMPSSESNGIVVPRDHRTFATLLAQGTLRMVFECSIETDSEFMGRAGRNNTSGSPFLRERVLYMPESFIRCGLYEDGYSSPSGLVPAVIDQSAELQATAEMLRDASQDAQLHANIQTSGDWPLQPIGSRIVEIGGTRRIDMTVSDERGAQIVAYNIDPLSLKYHYLTESVALELRDRDRRILGSTRVFSGSRSKANRYQR